MYKTFIFLIRLILGMSLGLLFLVDNTLAVDGVIEINQIRADAGGITFEDTAGFPVTISQSGSYVLTSNLDVPAGTEGIFITTPDVSIDLNGFTIAGNGGDRGHGISSVEAGLNGRITLRNGVVRSMGNYGIYVGDQSLVEGIHAYDNGGVGINAGLGSTVSGNTARLNGYDGINTGPGSTVSRNTAQLNGYDGIYTSLGSTVSENTVYNNGGDGIFVSDGSTVSGNTVQGNDGYGLNLGNSSGYKGNVITGNTNGTVSGGIKMGTNVCGTDTTCP